MNSTSILVVVLGALALLVVVANDWWKRRLVKIAEKKGTTVRADIHNNKTPLTRIVVLILGIGVYAYLLNHPELTNRDFGPLTPLVRWMFFKHH
jgi:hypothetical protein